MPRARHTRLTDRGLGPTTQRSLRLPADLVKQCTTAIDAGIPDIHTLTDAVTDALWLWLYEAERIGTMVGHYTPADRQIVHAAHIQETSFDHPPTQEAPMIEPKEDWDGDGVDVDTSTGTPFVGAGLHLPSDAEVRRPNFANVDLPPSDD